MAKASKVKVVNQGPTGYIFFMAWIGALVYFVGQVDGFWNVILAFLKSLVWPAYVIYHSLQGLGV